MRNSMCILLIELYLLIVSENCCQNLSDLRAKIEKNEKATKSVNKQILLQLFMLNNSNTKIISALKNMDQKLQVIMKSNTKMKSMSMPMPTLPMAFINLLPVKSIEEVDFVESLLSQDTNIDYIKNQEELVCYIKFDNT